MVFLEFLGVWEGDMEKNRLGFLIIMFKMCLIFGFIKLDKVLILVSS